MSVQKQTFHLISPSNEVYPFDDEIDRGGPYSCKLAIELKVKDILASRPGATTPVKPQDFVLEFWDEGWGCWRILDDVQARFGSWPKLLKSAPDVIGICVEWRNRSTGKRPVRRTFSPVSTRVERGHPPMSRRVEREHSRKNSFASLNGSNIMDSPWSTEAASGDEHSLTELSQSPSQSGLMSPASGQSTPHTSGTPTLGPVTLEQRIPCALRTPSFGRSLSPEGRALSPPPLPPPSSDPPPIEEPVTARVRFRSPLQSPSVSQSEQPAAVASQTSPSLSTASVPAVAQALPSPRTRMRSPAEYYGIPGLPLSVGRLVDPDSLTLTSCRYNTQIPVAAYRARAAAAAPVTTVAAPQAMAAPSYVAPAPVAPQKLTAGIPDPKNQIQAQLQAQNLALEQQMMAQRSALEQQAATLACVVEYQQKKAQEEMLKKQYENQKQFLDAETKLGTQFNQVAAQEQ